jgi:hypothetical protein
VQILYCNKNERDIFMENFKPCLNYVGLFPSYIRHTCYMCATMERIVLFNSQNLEGIHRGHTHASRHLYTGQSLWQEFSAARSQPHTTAAYVSLLHLYEANAPF